MANQLKVPSLVIITVSETNINAPGGVRDHS